MKRFLLTPTGWLVFLLVELALLLFIARGVFRLFPGLSTTAEWAVVLALAVVALAGNYLVRRRFLSEQE